MTQISGRVSLEAAIQSKQPVLIYNSPSCEYLYTSNEQRGADTSNVLYVHGDFARNEERNRFIVDGTPDKFRLLNVSHGKYVFVADDDDFHGHKAAKAHSVADDERNYFHARSITGNGTSPRRYELVSCVSGRSIVRTTEQCERDHIVVALQDPQNKNDNATAAGAIWQFELSSRVHFENFSFLVLSAPLIQPQDPIKAAMVSGGGAGEISLIVDQAETQPVTLKSATGVELPPGCDVIFGFPDIGGEEGTLFNLQAKLSGSRSSSGESPEAPVTTAYSLTTSVSGQMKIAGVSDGSVTATALIERAVCDVPYEMEAVVEDTGARIASTGVYRASIWYNMRIEADRQQGCVINTRTTEFKLFR